MLTRTSTRASSYGQGPPLPSRAWDSRSPLQPLGPELPATHILDAIAGNLEPRLRPPAYAVNGGADSAPYPGEVDVHVQVCAPCEPPPTDAGSVGEHGRDPAGAREAEQRDAEPVEPFLPLEEIPAVALAELRECGIDHNQPHLSLGFCPSVFVLSSMASTSYHFDTGFELVGIFKGKNFIYLKIP